ncbi:MAG: OstA-like protein [Bacteroidota bacterium]
MLRLNFFFIFLISLSPLFGQKPAKIKLLKADYSRYDIQIAKNAQRLIGNVKLSHQGTLMQCDSAWLFENENRVKAFSKIRINQGDSLRLEGDLLEYSGENQVADISGNIRMSDRAMLLETEYLLFNMEENTATYINGGEITNRENNNVLTSEKGTYFTDHETFHFKENVILNNPDYTIETDTLHYREYNSTADFLGPTFIRGEENLIYCENGYYDTENDLARFGQNAYVWFDGQKLEGDSLFYDRNSGIGIAKGNVAIQDTLNDFIIQGNIGRHLEKEEISFVTGRAEYIQVFENDSLFLHADTLKAVPDTLNQKKIQCFSGAKFYKSDMQGACDSLIYSERDSAFYMYEDPVIWNEENQITGDFIQLNTLEDGLDDMKVRGNSFIISKVDDKHYNQIKGRNMNGHFSQNELVKVDVIGNGTLVYYPTEETEEGDQKIIGLNRALCSDIQIRIKDREITYVNLQNQTDSKFLPLEMASEQDKVLKGFEWKGALRPMNRKEIF